MAVPEIAAGSQPPAAALPDGLALPAGPLAAGVDAAPDGDGLDELLHAANRKTVTTARVNSLGRMATSSRCPAGEARGACTGPRGRVRIPYERRGCSEGSGAPRRCYNRAPTDQCFLGTSYRASCSDFSFECPEPAAGSCLGRTNRIIRPIGPRIRQMISHSHGFRPRRGAFW